MNHTLHELRYLFTTYPLDFYSYFFLLLPMLIAIYRRSFLTNSLSVIVSYFFVRFLGDTLMLSYSLISKNNLNLSKALLLLDVLLISWFYFISVKGDSFSRKLTTAVTMLVLGTAIFNYLIDGPLSVGRSGLRLLMVILSLTYFNKILAENQIKKVILHSAFWVSSGFLFYGSGTLLIAISADYLQTSPQDVYDIYSNMDQLISVLLSCLVAVGVWMSKYDRDNYYTGLV